MFVRNSFKHWNLFNKKVKHLPWTKDWWPKNESLGIFSGQIWRIVEESELWVTWSKWNWNTSPFLPPPLQNASFQKKLHSYP